MDLFMKQDSKQAVFIFRYPPNLSSVQQKVVIMQHAAALCCHLSPCSHIRCRRLFTAKHLFIKQP